MVCMRRMDEGDIIRPHYRVVENSNIFQVWANGGNQGESIMVELPNIISKPMRFWRPNSTKDLTSWYQKTPPEMHTITYPLQIQGFANNWTVFGEVFRNDRMETWWGFWARTPGNVWSEATRWVVTGARIPHRQEISGADYRPRRRQ